MQKGLFISWHHMSVSCIKGFGNIVYGYCMTMNAKNNNPIKFSPNSM